MVNITCISCGDVIELDDSLIPYEGDLCCPSCEIIMSAMINFDEEISSIHLKYPTYNELYKFKLNQLEKKSLREASISLGTGAFTASEIMSLRTLESILRRIYNQNKNLGGLISQMVKDKRLSDLHGVVSYFKDVRNRTAHPEKVSTKLEAESTFVMTKRLIVEIHEKIKPPKNTK